MELKIGSGRNCFYQWDTGQILIIEGAESCNEVHFCNGQMETALICRIREEDGQRVADVPNILLQTDAMITAYLFCYGEDGSETRISKSFQVLHRPKPESYVYIETEVLNYGNLDKRLTDLEGEGLTGAVADYLEKNPVQAGATVEEAAQIARNRENIEQLSADKLDADKLPQAVNDALAQAKASGEFDGPAGADGKDYTLTEADMREIAEQAASLVEVPSGGGSAYTDTVILNTELTEEVSEVSVVLTEEMKDAILNADFIFASAHISPAAGTTANGGLYYGIYGNYYTQLVILTNGNGRVANCVPYEGSGKTGYVDMVFIRENSCADGYKSTGNTYDTIFLQLGHYYTMAASNFKNLRTGFQKVPNIEQKLRIHTDAKFGIGSKFKFIARRLSV